jgi:hypothetical protein
LWDTWFDEKITYEPTTGQLEYYINGTNRISFNVGALPTTNTTTMSMFFQAYGWWTGHYLLFDDLRVTQEMEASGPVESRDTDLDGVPDWAEIVAGTSERNPASFLRLQVISPSATVPGGYVLEWASAAGIYYSVNRSTNLLVTPNLFTPIQTGIPGLPGTTTYTDPNPPPAGPCFYRIGVDF